ncbi:MULTISPECIES: LysR family transcriptional regulator [Ramlibacter]|uniref:LysR family transcriptional regulator n=1 Tax=Ramlibacter pinisoli TaxID=2682844 RepID=A0A6N8IWG0_9BURK|nr:MULTISPECIES: LysR family transcriptional regulator [Ramlibacter]MBA2961174.1 LysR family transcriptional regulator [Ramlibacter sp. CGMCC 1.13660]MVQ31118.1 LysR family transcriptional regulator [Ramlibacter pinisoli]
MRDLNDMLFFAEVVDRGGFAAAGRALGIPKSRLSRRVADLEAHLGVRLLQRTTRKLSLTEAGEQFHRHCVAMREQAEAAEEAVAVVHGEPRGTIRVTCPVTLAQTMVGAVLPLFLERHPQVRLDMQVTNRVVDLVQEGVDVALRVRQSVDDSGSLVVKKLSRTWSWLLATPGLLDRLGRPHGIEDLARLPTVAMSAADGRASWRLLGPGGREHDLQHRPLHTADDLLALKYLALQGLGMSVLPDYMCARDVREGRLEHVLPGWMPPAGVVHAVFPSRRGMVPAVRRFLDFLGEHLTEEAFRQECP